MAVKRIIWTSDIDTSDEGISAYRKEILDEDKDFTDEDVRRIMDEDNTNQLYNEKSNLNVETTNPILVMANLGLWHGRRTAYRVLNGCNVSEILEVSCGGYVTFYADAYNVHCEDIHHDGTNRYTFRELIGDEDQCYPLLDALYKGKDEATIKRLMQRYSRSILPYVADVYGWPVAGRRKAVA